MERKHPRQLLRPGGYCPANHWRHRHCLANHPRFTLANFIRLPRLRPRTNQISPSTRWPSNSSAPSAQRKFQSGRSHQFLAGQRPTRWTTPPSNASWAKPCTFGRRNFSPTALCSITGTWYCDRRKWRAVRVDALADAHTNAPPAQNRHSAGIGHVVIPDFWRPDPFL